MAYRDISYRRIHITAIVQVGTDPEDYGLNMKRGFMLESRNVARRVDTIISLYVERGIKNIIFDYQVDYTDRIKKAVDELRPLLKMQYMPDALEYIVLTGVEDGIAAYRTNYEKHIVDF